MFKYFYVLLVFGVILLGLVACTSQTKPQVPTELTPLFNDGDIDRATLSPLSLDVQSINASDMDIEIEEHNYEDKILPNTFADQDVLTAQDVHPRATGFVAYIEHQESTNKPWKLYRHDQLTDTRLLVYAGLRRIQSVAISLDGNTLSAIMESHTSTLESNFEVYRLTINNVRAERYTVTSYDEKDISISADANLWVWQGVNLANSKRAIYLREFSGISFTDSLLNTDTHQEQPTISGNGKNIAFIRLGDGGGHRVMVYNKIANLYQTVIRIGASSSNEAKDPSISNDGNKVAYLYKGNSNYKIQIRQKISSTFQDATLSNILTSTDELSHPHLGADGKFITYNKEVNGVYNIFTKHLASGETVRNKPSSHKQIGPFWQKAADVARTWSSAATWGGNRPQAGDMVTIPVGKTIYLDIDTPPLAGLTINGNLVFAKEDLVLTAGWIIVNGNLQIGSKTRPFRNKATIKLTGGSGENVQGMGNRFIAVRSGGSFTAYGKLRSPSWTRLAQTAKKRDSQIVLKQAVNWQIGDRIVIASTDYDYTQAEERSIVAISGSTVTLNKPLTYEHWGAIQSYDGHRVDARAEVGNLSRNIVIQAINDSESKDKGFGGHVMAMKGGLLELSGVEFFRMGQSGLMGRYPVHWHLAGDASGSFVKNSSIHHSFNRCVTIHGAHNVVVKNNVAYEALGHCYFLEDGIETGNTFENNLGLSIHKPEAAQALLPTDRAFLGPAVYWITNPDNILSGNVAAGSEGTGFWYALPEHPTGPSTTNKIYPRRTPLGEFSGNVAHSNGVDGLHVDRGPRASDLNSETTYYKPVRNPANPDSRPVWAVFDSFTAYKNRNHAVWLRGRNHIVRDGTFADNAIGVTMASSNSYVETSAFIGETANKGTPQSWEYQGLDGRSLPRPWDCENCYDKAIRGFELYDGTVGAKDNYFAKFEPNSLRQAAAISQLDFTDFTVSPQNYTLGVKLASGTNPVYFHSRSVPSQPGGEDGYRSTVFKDRDGSLTGTVGRTITVNNPFLVNNKCDYRQSWNAWVCDNDYVGLTFNSRDVSLGELSIISRSGKTHTMLGTHAGDTDYTTNLIVKTSYSYTYGGNVPRRMRLGMRYAKPNQWVIVDIPYTHSNVFVYRDYWIHSSNLLSQAASLSELQNSSGEKYYRSGNKLYLKLYVQADREWAVLDVCQNEGCS